MFYQKHCKNCGYWFEYVSECGSCLLAETTHDTPVEGTLAYAKNHKDQWTELVTMHDFGCVQHARKKKHWLGRLTAFLRFDFSREEKK